MQFSDVFVTLSLFVFTCGAAAHASETPHNYDRVIRQALRLESARDYTHAANILEAAITSAVQDNQRAWVASMLGLLGSIYQRSGKYTEAESALDRSVSLWTELKGPNAEELVGPLGNLGGLYYEAGQQARAEKFMSKAIAIEAGSENQPDVLAALLVNQGDIYFSEHKDELAKQNAGEALKKLAIVQNSNQNVAAAYSLLGAVDVRARDWPEAESHLRQALTIWQSSRGPRDPHTGEGTANLATYFSASGKPALAEPLFQQADQIFDASGGDPAFIQHFLAEYVATERKLGHKKEVKRLVKKLDAMVPNSAEFTISREEVDVNALRAGK